MNRFFNMDNMFFVFMGSVADLIILNLLCILCCIPIVTAGASITAMYYVTLKMARDEESYIVRSFFKSFKENFKQATIINVIMLVTALMLFLDLSIVRNMDGTLYKVLFSIFIAFTFLYLLLFLYIYPVLAKFYNTIKNTFVNAFLMAIRHLPYTFLMLVISLVPIAIFFIPSFQIQSIALMLFFLMGFAVVSYCNSKFLVKIFDNYVPKEEDEDNSDKLPDSGDTPQ